MTFAAWGVIHWILLGLSGAGIVGGLLARRWSVHAGLIVSVCGLFFLASASLTGSLASAQRSNGQVEKQIAVIADPNASEAARAEARNSATWYLSDLREGNIESAIAGLIFGLTSLLLVLAITRPTMLLSAVGREILAAQKARKGHKTHPMGTGTTA